MKRKSVMALLLSLSMTTAMMGYGGAVASAESTEATTEATDQKLRRRRLPRQDQRLPMIRQLQIR